MVVEFHDVKVNKLLQCKLILADHPTSIALQKKVTKYTNARKPWILRNKHFPRKICVPYTGNMKQLRGVHSYFDTIFFCCSEQSVMFGKNKSVYAHEHE